MGAIFQNLVLYDNVIQSSNVKVQLKLKGYNRKCYSIAIKG
jgi:hypothetical protein